MSTAWVKMQEAGSRAHKLLASLFTLHSSPSLSPRHSVLRGAYNPAKHHSKIAQRRAAGRAYNPAKHHFQIAQRRAAGRTSNPAKHHSKIAQRRAGGRAYNPAKHHSKIAQRRAGGRAYSPGETALSDCPAPGRRPSVLCPLSDPTLGKGPHHFDPFTESRRLGDK